mmetsp:Transcript_42100/g.98759  ORF Transcript_42100/g.98759 Transcript_42100/m.98759 type:complete len:89 (-) Transcript_42100:15-281(-)
MPGEVVLDPMVGKAITLLEAADYWPCCSFIGADMDLDQLLQAQENASANPAASCSLAYADARVLPLADGRVDAVICDMPYGILHGASI